MSDSRRVSQPAATSRRDFLKVSTVSVGAGVLGGLSLARSVHAQGSDVFKIALIGCGGRGTGAAVQALSTKANVKLVAMADAFRDTLDRSYEADQEEMQATASTCPRIASSPDWTPTRRPSTATSSVVLLCTPPGFRPMQFEAAVKAGKHVFMEKPLAVDGPGVRRILAANEEAKKKNLAVVVGFHMRHEANRQAAVKMLHDGAIGDILFLRAYYNCSGVWVRPREPGQTEMQYQVRNWYYFNWLCGDHIVEQHVHDLDMCNWIKQAHPVEANGMGGRQVRTGKDVGEIFDHHAVEFTYADGTKTVQLLPPHPQLLGRLLGIRPRHQGPGRVDGTRPDDDLADRRRAAALGSRRRRPPDGARPPVRRAAGRQAVQRGRFGRRQHVDGDPGADGDLLGQDRQVGRGDELATRPFAEELRLGRRAAGPARPGRLLRLCHAGHHQGVLRRGTRLALWRVSARVKV